MIERTRNIEVVGIGKDSEAEMVKESIFDAMPQINYLYDRGPLLISYEIKRKKYYVPKK